MSPRIPEFKKLSRLNRNKTTISKMEIPTQNVLAFKNV